MHVFRLYRIVYNLCMMYTVCIGPYMHVEALYKSHVPLYGYGIALYTEGTCIVHGAYMHYGPYRTVYILYMTYMHVFGLYMNRIRMYSDCIGSYTTRIGTVQEPFSIV